jgi:hypothetical protein
METETPTPDAPAQLITLRNDMGARLVVTRAELVRIVQEAGDQHGISWTPF